MHKKTILLFALAALLILGAFAAPGLLLDASVKQAAEDVKLLDASDYAINPLENTVEKLNCAFDPSVTTVQMGLDSEPPAVGQLLTEELRKLYQLGAVSREIYDSITSLIEEGVTVERVCVIQPERQLVFEEYVLRCWAAEIEAALDVSSGKLLHLSYVAGREGILWNELKDESLEEKRLQGWADYYGLTLQEVVRSPHGFEELRSYANPFARYEGDLLYQGRMRDDSGRELLFGLFYEFGDHMVERYSWMPGA